MCQLGIHCALSQNSTPASCCILAGHRPLFSFRLESLFASLAAMHNSSQHISTMINTTTAFECLESSCKRATDRAVMQFTYVSHASSQRLSKSNSVCQVIDTCCLEYSKARYKYVVWNALWGMALRSDPTPFPIVANAAKQPLDSVELRTMQLV